jgi:hypothetical protein
MELLNLSIPEQHDYNDPTVERDVVRLQAWLTNLPLMDVVETVRLVLDGLQSLNEQRLETDLRYRLLDVFRHTAHRLFVTMDPMHLRQLALSKTQREQATEGDRDVTRGVRPVTEPQPGASGLCTAGQLPFLPVRAA